MRKISRYVAHFSYFERLFKITSPKIAELLFVEAPNCLMVVTKLLLKLIQLDGHKMLIWMMLKIYKLYF